MITSKPVKTCMVQNGRRKVHSTWEDGTECIEEYDDRTTDLLVRKWRRRTNLGKLSPWENEIGEISKVVVGDLKESSDSPFIVRKDSKTMFIWRIRNLIYAKDNYNASIQDNQVVIRTCNKKYFKKISIPDMDRFKIPLVARDLQVEWSQATLVISYPKPREVIEWQRQEFEQAKQIKETTNEGDCKQT